MEPSSGRVGGGATRNEAEEAQNGKNMQGPLVTKAFAFHSRRKGTY